MNSSSNNPGFLFSEQLIPIEIQFDGGCAPNPGLKYGSYEIRENGKVLEWKQRFPLGHGTSNEAEFEALAESLNGAIALLSKRNSSLTSYRLDLFTDSTIVRNRINHGLRRPQFGENSHNERRVAMALRASLCLQLIAKFGGFTIQWVPRDRNVESFGH